MRTNRTQFIRVIPLALLSFILLLLTGCNYGKNETPVADPNPVMLTSATQSKNVKVTNTNAIRAEGDNMPLEGIYTENDWVKITFDPSKDKQHIIIEVEENNTENSRIYVLGLLSYVRDSELLIIQEGKKE